MHPTVFKTTPGPASISSLANPSAHMQPPLTAASSAAAADRGLCQHKLRALSGMDVQDLSMISITPDSLSSGSEPTAHASVVLLHSARLVLAQFMQTRWQEPSQHITASCDRLACSCCAEASAEGKAYVSAHHGKESLPQGHGSQPGAGC